MSGHWTCWPVQVDPARCANQERVDAWTGRDFEEVIEVMKDCRRHDVDMLTLGQYLQPSRDHLPVDRYVHPDEFERLPRKQEHLVSNEWRAAHWSLVLSSGSASGREDSQLASFPQALQSGFLLKVKLFHALNTPS